MSGDSRSVRALASFLLVVVGAVLLPVGVLGLWAQREVVHTDAYVTTVAPLAADLGVQDAVATEVTDRLLEAVRQNAALGQLLAPGTTVGDATSAQLQQLVLRLVQSPQFAAVWEDANRRLQESTLAALRGEPGGPVRIDGSRVLVNTNVLLLAAQDQLAQTLPLVGSVDLSSAGREVVALDHPAVTAGRTTFSWLESLAPWALPVAVLALVVGVLLARERWRVLTVVGVLVVCAGGVVALSVASGESAAYRALAGSVLEPAATAVVGALAASADAYARALLVVGATLAVVGGAGWLVRARSPH